MTTPDPTVELRSEAELQHQLRDFLQQLSPEQLHELAEFAGYLAEAEGETITQELLNIPGLRSSLKPTSEPQNLTPPPEL